MRCTSLILLVGLLAGVQGAVVAQQAPQRPAYTPSLDRLKQRQEYLITLDGRPASVMTPMVAVPGEVVLQITIGNVESRSVEVYEYLGQFGDQVRLLCRRWIERRMQDSTVSGKSEREFVLSYTAYLTGDSTRTGGVTGRMYRIVPEALRTTPLWLELSVTPSKNEAVPIFRDRPR